MHKEYNFGVGVGKGVMAAEISSLATHLVYFVVKRENLSNIITNVRESKNVNNQLQTGGLPEGYLT